jgi:D-sedoheptulose 7-phosphate isomerase|tara:strand:- start:1499 stop:2077 length:579 start_codon:yes stop_codon:yes gene_type:complete
MDLQTSVENSLLEHTQVISRILSELAPSIVVVGNVLATVLAGGGTVFWCGNGGSAADSQHMAGELIGRFVGDRQPLRSVALTTDSSVLTCIANDYDYGNVFARQVEALVGQGDVLMVLSTSGNSENVVRALEVARGRGAVTVALLGKGGGIAGEAADHAIVVDSDSTARIQEAHIVIGHIVCELIEKELGLA